MRIINFNIKLTKSQQKIQEFIDDLTARIIVWVSSRQSGKSVMSEIALIQYLCRPKTFNAYISPTFANGRKVYKELCNLLEDTGLIKSANSSTLTIETTTKSTLQFFSIDSPSAIRGNTVNGICVLDEAAYFSDVLPNGEEPFANVIFPILKANWKTNKLLMISTPQGKRGFFYESYIKSIRGHSQYRHLKTDIYKDELVSEEQLNMMKESMPKLAWQQEFECKFLDSALTYFSGFEECFKEYTYNPHSYQYIGIDLSATEDGDNTILTLINQERQTKSIKIDGNLTHKYNQIAHIINNTKNLKRVYIEENGVGFAMIDSIKKKLNKPQIVEPWTTTSQSKMEILSALAIAITDKVISFDKNDNFLFGEFGTFVYKYTKKGNLQLAAQAGKHDDTVMSMAIAYKAWQDGTRQGTYKLSSKK